MYPPIYGIWPIDSLDKKDSQKIQTTMSTYLSSPIINKTDVTENITPYLEQTTIYSSSLLMNSTTKSNATNRNRIFISLSISSILLLLCISLSYCIFLYLKHVLNEKGNGKQDAFEFNRLSMVSSAYSSDAQVGTCKTEEIRSVKDLDRTNEERHSLTDAVKLFRY